MSDVIDFPDLTQKDEIWVCGCGCRSFELRANGTAACSACEGVIDVETGGWYDKIVDGPEWNRETPVFVDLAGGETAEFARAHLARAAADPSARAVIVVWQTDRVTAWLDATTPEDFTELCELIDSYRVMAEITVEGSE